MSGPVPADAVWPAQPGELRLGAPEEIGPALAHDLIVCEGGRIRHAKGDLMGRSRAFVEVWRLEDGLLVLRVQGHPTLSAVTVPVPLGGVMTTRGPE